MNTPTQLASKEQFRRVDELHGRVIDARVVEMRSWQLIEIDDHGNRIGVADARALRDWLNKVLPEPTHEPPVALTDEQIRVLTRKFGGDFHGPKVEHVSMEEQAYFRMIRSLSGLGYLTAGIAELREALRTAQPPGLRYEEGLAILYGVNYQAVARVCDEVIDRSGALLGRVRTLARSAPTKSGEQS